MSPMIRRSGLAVGALALMGVCAFALSSANADTTPAMAPTPASVTSASPAGTVSPSAADPATLAALTPADHKGMMMRYCTGCHNDKLKTAGMSVVPLDPNNLTANLDTWEKILRRVSLGEMPLRGAPRPPKERLVAFTSWLETSLDALGKAHPNPGRATVRRMNRTEYANAVRDVLGFEVNMTGELPADDTGYGFDNIADILTVSPTLMDRYINVAGKISRLATGQASQKVGTTDFKLTKDLFENAFGVPSYNERADDGLPLDSRGGGLVKFYAPYDATYNIQVYLNSGTGTETEIDANNRYELKVPLKAGLRAAMKTETEMFFTGIVQENRSIVDFLDADYTYLNQRLAEHYGVPGVYGTAFRKVQLDPAVHRGGLLGQGSILTVTSYNNRTSVVLRGKWVLENILAAPPPAPPPNIPSLNEVKNGKMMTVREQMEMHRSNPVCASCHTKMEPFGFSLENFNAIGAWRTSEIGKPIDVSAVMPDGTKFAGPSGPGGLTGILLSRKDQFADAFTERLMTYALGRGLEGYDMPAVRNVRYAAAKDGYRMQSIILGIVQSVPFSMRRTPQT